jgi:hypothetical protein
VVAGPPKQPRQKSTIPIVSASFPRIIMKTIVTTSLSSLVLPMRAGNVPGIGGFYVSRLVNESGRCVDRSLPEKGWTKTHPMTPPIGLGQRRALAIIVESTKLAGCPCVKPWVIDGASLLLGVF